MENNKIKQLNINNNDFDFMLDNIKVNASIVDAIYGGYTIYNQDFIRINYAADSNIIDTTASKITGEHITKGFYESGFFDAEVINGRILYDSFLNASPSDAFRIEFIKFVANQLIEYLEWKIEKQRIIDKA